MPPPEGARTDEAPRGKPPGLARKRGPIKLRPLTCHCHSGKPDGKGKVTVRPLSVRGPTGQLRLDRMRTLWQAAFLVPVGENSGRQRSEANVRLFL